MYTASLILQVKCILMPENRKNDLASVITASFEAAGMMCRNGVLRAQLPQLD